jgi:hypothetical protein
MVAKRKTKKKPAKKKVTKSKSKSKKSSSGGGFADAIARDAAALEASYGQSRRDAGV